ncbi:MAG: GspL/Epsl periplasmic domain-containing protein [Mariprofundaceae bacterium]|nr:GspL/Epsl periplasmic domain-containing protein [Mariprofundaceae bacterium]
MATLSDNTQTYLNWDGHRLACYHADHGLMCDDQENTSTDAVLLPERPETLSGTLMHGAIALWPLESMLVRSLHLPLKSVALLDADILQQELADRVGIDPEAWYLCWNFAVETDGIRGLVFGIPETLRQAMADSSDWQHLMHLGVDGWHRLQPYADADLAILEEDDDGLFFGVFLSGCWHGMRRINGLMDASVWSQVVASLESMGFDPTIHALDGQINTATLAHIQAIDWSWQGSLLKEPIPRYHANLRSLTENNAWSRHAPNFRRGRWAARGSWQSFRPCLRSVTLAGVLLALLLFGQLASISNLQQQQDDAESRIVAAFHQGLPDEGVMLDALAQLRQAVERQGKTARTPYLLKDLQAISKSYKKQAWRMKSLNLQRGKMQLTGEIADVKGLNQLQHNLEKEMKHSVRIVDTNLGVQVSFRLAWTWQ